MCKHLFTLHETTLMSVVVAATMERVCGLPRELRVAARKRVQHTSLYGIYSWVRYASGV